MTNLQPEVLTTQEKSQLGVTVQVIVEFDKEPFSFKLYVEGKYPKQSPTLICTSPGLQAIADGRDLLKDVLKHEWRPRTTLAEVLKGLSVFLVSPIQTECKTLLTSGSSLTSIGTFHLGYPMHLDLWSSHSQTKVFQCAEVDPRGFRSPRDRVLVLTQTWILTLEPSVRHPGIGHLIMYATYAALQAVTWVKFNKDVLSLHWKQQNSEEVLVQQLSSCESEKVIEAISQRAIENNIEVERIVAPEPLEDGNSKSIPQVDIDRLVMEINATESEVAKTPTLDAVNALLAAFQKVIEYYSALGDAKYDLYLSRMHEVLRNKSIQQLLGYVDEVAKPGNGSGTKNTLIYEDLPGVEEAPLIQIPVSESKETIPEVPMEPPPIDSQEEQESLVIVPQSQEQA